MMMGYSSYLRSFVYKYELVLKGKNLSLLASPLGLAGVVDPKNFLLPCLLWNVVTVLVG